MAEPRAPDPVKLVAAILERDEEALAGALRLLEERFGPIDHHGSAHPFRGTDYYRAEMGEGLRRRFVSFERLIAPEAIVEAKEAAGEIEEALRGPTGRRVNIDPGYLDLHKLVLASWKEGPMKVHLGKGVWADIIARYSQGRFHPVEWTFRDFQEGLYDEDLLAIRARYVAGRAQGAR